MLKKNESVVFDFAGGIAHWKWLKNIAEITNANIEIYHLDAPLEVRVQRIKKRTEEKQQDVYHFTMSEEEVIASKTTQETPPASERVKIIKIMQN